MPRQQKGKRGQSPPAATTNFANQKAASQAAPNTLNSLRRVDPSIVEILASATHATLYNFGADQEWERADVEGPLFIAARNAHPRVRLVVLNRLSMTNMVEDVDDTFGTISASRVPAVPSRHRRASSPGEEVVGGLFFDVEAVRTESSDRDAPRRIGSRR